MLMLNALALIFVMQCIVGVSLLMFWGIYACSNSDAMHCTCSQNTVYFSEPESCLARVWQVFLLAWFRLQRPRKTILLSSAKRVFKTTTTTNAKMVFWPKWDLCWKGVCCDLFVKSDPSMKLVVSNLCKYAGHRMAMSTWIVQKILEQKTMKYDKQKRQYSHLATGHNHLANGHYHVANRYCHRASRWNMFITCTVTLSQFLSNFWFLSPLLFEYWFSKWLQV